MMMRAVAGLLVITVIGIPLRIAPTGTTAALAGVAGLLAWVGLWTRISAFVAAAVAVGLVEGLVAMLLAGTPPDLWLALLLGIVIYLLLDVGAFMTNFHGVAVDAGVYRMKAMYWGWTAVFLGLVGLVVGLLAALLARPLAGPLLPQALAIVAAGIVVGTVVVAMRLWHKEG